MCKIFYAILCLFKNIKSAVHCKILADDLGIDFSTTHWKCEMLSVKDAFYLMGAGIEPVNVSYSKFDTNDHFYFHRTPKLLTMLANYHKMLNDSVADIEYDDLAHVYEIPRGNLSPNSIEDLEAPFQPHGYARERFAYLSWPVEMRKKYISSSADSRREMIAAAYARG